MRRPFAVFGLCLSILSVVGCLPTLGVGPGEHDYSDFHVFDYQRTGIAEDGDIATARVTRQTDATFLLEIAVFVPCEEVSGQDSSSSIAPCTRSLGEFTLGADAVAGLLAAFADLRVEQSPPFGPCVEPISIDHFTWDGTEIDDWPYACPFSKSYLANPEAIVAALQNLRDAVAAP